MSSTLAASRTEYLQATITSFADLVERKGFQLPRETALTYLIPEIFRALIEEGRRDHARWPLAFTELSDLRSKAIAGAVNRIYLACPY